MNRLLSAIAFAAHKHRDQRRKDLVASPYINHPIGLANVLANEAGIEDERILLQPSCTTPSKIEPAPEIRTVR